MPPKLPTNNNRAREKRQDPSTSASTSAAVSTSAQTQAQTEPSPSLPSSSHSASAAQFMPQAIYKQINQSFNNAFHPWFNQINIRVSKPFKVNTLSFLAQLETRIHQALSDKGLSNLSEGVTDFLYNVQTVQNLHNELRGYLRSEKDRTFAPVFNKDMRARYLKDPESIPAKFLNSQAGKFLEGALLKKAVEIIFPTYLAASYQKRDQEARSMDQLIARLIAENEALSSEIHRLKTPQAPHSMGMSHQPPIQPFPPHYPMGVQCLYVQAPQHYFPTEYSTAYNLAAAPWQQPPPGYAPPQYAQQYAAPQEDVAPNITSSTIATTTTTTTTTTATLSATTVPDSVQQTNRDQNPSRNSFSVGPRSAFFRVVPRGEKLTTPNP